MEAMRARSRGLPQQKWPIRRRGLTDRLERGRPFSSFLPLHSRPLQPRITLFMASKLRSGKRFRPDGHHLSSLLRFCLTPQEVQEHMLFLACRSPEESHEGDLTSRSLIVLDVKTTLSLLVTSRAVNALVTPILYANVCIDRPSVLVDLLRTLKAKPSLGKLVKSLQLGPTTHLPQHWWPMTYLYGPDEVFQERHFATSLTDQAVLPRWCCPLRRWRCPLRRWPLTSIQESFSCRDLCVKNAIEGAQIHINVRLREPRQIVRSRRAGLRRVARPRDDGSSSR